MKSDKGKRAAGIRKDAGTLFRMWKFTAPWKGRFAAGVLLGSTQPFVQPMLYSWMLAQTMAAITGGGTPALTRSLLAAGAIMVATLLLYPWCFYSIYATFSRASGLARKRLFNHIQGLPVPYVESHFSGEIATRMTTDLNDATQLFGYPTVGQYNPFAQALSIVGLVAVLLAVNLPLGLLSVAVSTLGMLVTVKISETIKKAERGAKEAIDEATQSMVDMMAGTTLVRMYGLSERMKRRYAEKTGSVFSESMKSVRRRSLLGSAIDLHLALCYLAVVGLGLAMAHAGRITIPEVVFIATLQTGIGQSMSMVTRSFARLAKYFVAAERVFEVLDAPNEEERQDLEKPDPHAEWAVTLEHVRFRYERGDRQVFDGLSLRVGNGERLALVGGSGGGKSSLFKLLLSFEQAQEGEITLFGHPLSAYGLGTLRSRMSLVPQDTWLFDGTIGENIAWGKPDATREQIGQAVRDACLDGFVSALPEGLNTRVGERGVQLSGGQRQRIAIARALLRDAPLLLLDEATSSLDSESEREVQIALERLMEGRTTILIAHRLSTIRHVDRIVVLEKGAVVEEGSHEALLARNGRFRELYDMQFAD